VANGRRVRGFHGVPVFGREGHHLPIARVMRLPVERFADHEEGPRTAFAVPARPGFRRLTEAPLGLTKSLDLIARYALAGL
jgi:hypothetical protein